MRPGHFHGRTLSLAGAAITGMVFGRPTDLLGPQDLRLFLLGLGFDGGVGVQQPLLDLVGVLLFGMAAGFLGRVAPAAQVQADAPFGQLDVALLADQVADGSAGPQRVRDAELLRRVKVDTLPDALGLLLGEETAGPEGPTTMTVRQSGESVGGIGGPPPANGFVANTEKIREFDLGVTQFNAA